MEYKGINYICESLENIKKLVNLKLFFNSNGVNDEGAKYVGNYL